MNTPAFEPRGSAGGGVIPVHRRNFSSKQTTKANEIVTADNDQNENKKKNIQKKYVEMGHTITKKNGNDNANNNRNTNNTNNNGTDNSATTSGDIHMFPTTRDEIKNAFNYVDQNGDNNIDIRELKHVLGELDKPTSHDHDVAVIIFKNMDTDGNGLISFEEFESWYLKSAAAMRQDVRRFFKKFGVFYCLFVSSRGSGTRLKNFFTYCLCLLQKFDV